MGDAVRVPVQFARVKVAEQRTQLFAFSTFFFVFLLMLQASMAGSVSFFLYWIKVSFFLRRQVSPFVSACRASSGL